MEALTRREGDLPTEGDTRVTRNVGILLAKETYCDIRKNAEIKLDLLQTTECQYKSEGEIQKAPNVDNEI